jgi:hypothetical protein
MIIMSSVIRIWIIITIDSEYALNPADDTTDYTPRNGSDWPSGLIANSGPVSSAARDTLSLCGKRH